MSQLHLPVEEFTTPNPITAKDDASLESLHRVMSENGIRHVPIINEKKVVGIISERDLKWTLGFSQVQQAQLCARDIMTKDPVTVNAGESLEKVAFEMSKRKIGSVIVNDENDELLGIFTVTDALNALIEISRDNMEAEFR